MSLSRLGEFGLIAEFKSKIKTDASVVVGSGDDCAVIKYNARQYLLYTCDMIIEDVDFCITQKPELIGRKALAVSVSDIASCGGIPRYCVVSMGIPKNMPLRTIRRISNGMFAISDEYKVNIVGGDLSSSRHLVIDVSMLGLVEKKYLVLRKGARLGDIIFVSGSLGGSIRGKHLEFTPRVKEARFLVDNFKVSSMIDISDGFLQDLGHILEASRAGAIIYEEMIPLNKEARGLNEALYMGEDFELLFTLSQDDAERLVSLRLREFTPVGKIMPRNFGLKLCGKNGKSHTPPLKGYRHF